MSEKPIFTSTGSLIIDEIHYEDGRKVYNVLGGAGVFAIYGMRLWRPPPKTQEIGFIVKSGFDYPKVIADQLDQIKINSITKHHPNRHTSHGINIFSANDHRDFEYKYPIIRTVASDFPDDWINSVKIVHIISSSKRAIDLVDEWKQRNPQSQTQFIWEPLPWAYLSEKFEMLQKASQKVDILTPNHEEIANILGYEFKELVLKNNNNVKTTVEYCSQELFKAIEKPSIVIVIRVSKYGAFIKTKDIAEWTPAYWDHETDQDHIVDVTGAGNAFCGGYAAGWIQTNQDPIQSALYGAISASYVVEQMGVPSLFENEVWNQGPSPVDRLELLKKKWKK